MKGRSSSEFVEYSKHKYFYLSVLDINFRAGQLTVRNYGPMWREWFLFFGLEQKDQKW